MNKITFLGAGSSVFAKNVLGDCLQTDCLREYEYALFDIDPVRLEDFKAEAEEEIQLKLDI